MVYYLKIHLSNDISFKGNEPIIWPLPQSPIQTVNFSDVDPIVELGLLSCDCILCNVVRVYLVISNNERGKKILVSLVMLKQPSGELHSPTIVSRKELVSHLHAVRVQV